MTDRNNRIFIDDVIGGNITHVRTGETMSFEFTPATFRPDRYALAHDLQEAHINPLITTLSSEEFRNILNQRPSYGYECISVDRSNLDNLDAMSYLANNIPISYSFEIVGTEDEQPTEEQSDKDIQNDETELNKFLDGFKK